MPNSVKGNSKYDWPTWVLVDGFLQRLGFKLDVCMTVAERFAETQAIWNIQLVPLRATRSVSLAHALREALLRQGCIPSDFLTHAHILPDETVAGVLHWLCCTPDSDDLTHWFFDSDWGIGLTDLERQDIETWAKDWRTGDGRTVWREFVRHP